jgi:hypothetical protein
MRSLVFGAATVVAMAASVAVKAADLAYPPPMVRSPQYGEAVPSVVVPPQLMVVPGPPAAFPQYRPSPYGVAPPVAPGVAVAPRGECPPVWSCGDRGCGWQSGCVMYPERYSGPYQSLDAQAYPEPQARPAPPAPYSGPYAPRVYLGPTGPANDRGPYQQ